MGTARAAVASKDTLNPGRANRAQPSATAIAGAINKILARRYPGRYSGVYGRLVARLLTARTRSGNRKDGAERLYRLRGNLRNAIGMP